MKVTINCSSEELVCEVKFTKEITKDSSRHPHPDGIQTWYRWETDDIWIYPISSSVEESVINTGEHPPIYVPWASVSCQDWHKTEEEFPQGIHRAIAAQAIHVCIERGLLRVYKGRFDDAYLNPKHF